jgi:hypothetical protein
MRALISALIVLVLAVYFYIAGPFGAAQTKGEASPVLVELFTSEGCSSCPPADALLSKLQGLCGNKVEVIALSEHVDYWNGLGWVDPYSDNLFTKRQYYYAKVLGQSNVYTPEMIVNGRTGFNGADMAKAYSVILSTLKAKTSRLYPKASCNDKNNSVAVTITIPQELNADQLELVVCLTEDNLVVDVRSGENAGRKLRHNNVVRAWKAISLSGRSGIVDIELPIKTTKINRADLNVVAFIQDKKTMVTLAIGKNKLTVLKAVNE